MEGRESTVSGSPTNTETESPMSGVVPQVMDVNMSMEKSISEGVASAPGTGTGTGTGGWHESLSRKKRGRPRKYTSDGNPVFTSGISPHYFSPPSDFSSKRGKGRPPGSRNRCLLASLGGLFASSAGGNFIPHVMTINTGEDVAAKIFSFSDNGPRAICILSANGAVSNVTIRQPGSSGGILTYEGRFEILSLSGSFTLADKGSGHSLTGGLSVSLAGPDGRVVGGGVAGLLMAASPIQVVVGSFMPNTHKIRKVHKKKYRLESIASPVPRSADVITTARPISQASPDEDIGGSPTSTLPEVPEQNQGEAEHSNRSNNNPNTTSFPNVGWQASQSNSDQRTSPDINLPGDSTLKVFQMEP